MGAEEKEIIHAAKWGNLGTLERLLQGGADPNERGEKGATALHHAAKSGWLEPVLVLLGAGADPNAADESGSTPLHWAALEGKENVAEALLEAGANARARNRNGALPAHHCKPDSPCEKVLGEWRAYAGHEREQEMRRMLEASAKREEELLRIQRETLSALKEMTGMLALALGIEKAGAEGQAEPEEGNLAKRLRSRPTRGVGEPEKEAGPGGGAGM